MSSLGLKLAIQYALPSCQLGFCGPRDRENQKLLVDFASGKKVPPEKVRRILEKFEAMYPYLKLISSSNQVSDPFDEQVVRALWIGNKLLESVKREDLQWLIITDFTKPNLLSKKEAERRAAQVPKGMVPHHSFHVLFLGSITGRVNLKEALKELCRIGWGKAIEVRGQRSEVRVRYRPLVLGEKMGLGEEVEKEIEWDSAVVSGIKEGDWISFHWGQVCDRLSKEDVSNLEHYTKRTISGLSR